MSKLKERKKCIEVKGRNLCEGHFVIGKGEHVGYHGQITRIGKSTITIVHEQNYPRRPSTKHFHRVKRTEFVRDFVW